MNFDEILVYCEKHEGYQKCNCSEKANTSRQPTAELSKSKNDKDNNNASKIPQIYAAIVGRQIFKSLNITKKQSWYITAKDDLHVIF